MKHFIIVLFWSVLTTVYAEDDELVLVHAVFRHGDRAPSQPYPNDPYNETQWHNGWKQLTTRGMRQAYFLGQFLEQEYKAGQDGQPLLSDEYKREEVYVRSTSTGRAMATALCLLSALYYPDTQQQFHKSISWQPVPVESELDTSKDYLLKPTSTDCPAYDKQLEDLSQSIIEASNDGNKEFYENVTRNAGFKKTLDLSTIGDVYTAAFRETVHGLTQPDWLLAKVPDSNETVYERVLRLTNQYDVFESTFPGAAKYLAGYLLGDIIQNMQDKVNGKLTKRMIIYSAHAGTVKPLLAALHIPFDAVPPYTACVLVELWRNGTSGKHWVRVRYSASADHGDMQHRTALLQTMSFCDNSTDCALALFSKALTDSVFWDKTQREQACALPHTKSAQSLTWATPGFVLSVVLLVMSMSAHSSCASN